MNKKRSDTAGIALPCKEETSPIGKGIALQVEEEMDEFLQPSIAPNKSTDKHSDYPEWAPKVLIESLHRRLKRKHDLLDHERWIEEQCADKQLSKEYKTLLLERLYRSRFALPFDEGNKLIETLLTGEEMKDVWVEIDRRSQSWTDPIDFALECNFALAGWRGEPKLSNKGRRNLFLELANTSEQLATLMCKTREFDRYSITDQITDADIRWLQNMLGPEFPEDDADAINYAREQISLIFPSFIKLLRDITIRSREYSKIPPIVRKPGSVNAEVHYFVRIISEYFQRKYGDPLHPLVTRTMKTIFGDNINDESYVRKL